MVVIPFPPCNAEQFQARLFRVYPIEVPLVEWNDRTFGRVSLQGYNTRADIDALVNALRELLPQVATVKPNL